MDEIMVNCPLVDRKISAVDCMENRDIKEQSVPDEYKAKENWKDICKNCQYFKM